MSLNQFEWIEDYDGLFEEQIPSQLLQNPLLQKDIWLTKEDLGLEIHEHHKVLTLNFSQISQSWLKVLVQFFILTRANVITSPDTLQHEIGHLNRLSKFLDEKYISSPKYINSQLFEEFDNWIRSKKKKLSERTISLHYTTFSNFFTTCRLEQQKYIREQFGDSYNNLFCSNNGGQNFKFIPIDRIMVVNTFNRWLNKLAEEYNICSKNGKVWYFTSHQFRRTVGTIMTNAGVRDLIIQKYLRHRNPDMQKHYKHLLKEVIGEEYQELTKEKNFVNIEGKIVSTHKPQDAIEEYMRIRLLQITTQQGECHRSNLKKPCPTVNGCWRCEDWMTSEKDVPYLKEDLERLKDELEKANKLGMVRVAKEIQKDINYLQIRINTLEEIINND